MQICNGPISTLIQGILSSGCTKFGAFIIKWTIGQLCCPTTLVYFNFHYLCTTSQSCWVLLKLVSHKCGCVNFRESAEETLLTSTPTLSPIIAHTACFWICVSDNFIPPTSKSRRSFSSFLITGSGAKHWNFCSLQIEQITYGQFMSNMENEVDCQHFDFSLDLTGFTRVTIDSQAQRRGIWLEWFSITLPSQMSLSYATDLRTGVLALLIVLHLRKYGFYWVKHLFHASLLPKKIQTDTVLLMFIHFKLICFCFHKISFLFSL